MTFLKFLSLLLLSVLGNQYLLAQVYTIDPIYQVGCFTMNDDAYKFNNFFNEKTAEIKLNKIRSSKIGIFKIDIDNNTLYNPEYNFTHKILTKNFDELKGQWVFEVDFREESGSVWQKYLLQLDEKGNAIFIEQSKQLKGDKNKTIFYECYTTDLKYMSFSKYCFRGKSVTFPSIEIASLKDRNEYTKKELSIVKHHFVMQNALLTWTEYPDYHLQKKKGSGPEPIVKTFKIESCTAINDSLFGIELICTELNETEIDNATELDIEIAKKIYPVYKKLGKNYYKFSYFETRNRMALVIDPKGQSYQNYISVEKFTPRNRTFYILKRL